MNILSCKSIHDSFTTEELNYLESIGVVWKSEEEFNKLTEQYEEVCIEVDNDDHNLHFSFNSIVIED